MKRFLPALSLALVVTVAACGSDDAEQPEAPVTTTPTTTAAPASSLDGRTYLATGVEGQTLADGATLQLSFDDGAISSGGGCNTIGGDYTLDGDHHLVVDGLIQTEMACADEALMQQDEWVAALLQARPTLTVDGDSLTLSDGTVTVVFTDREVADPDRPLEGTTWMVESVVDDTSVSTVPEGASLVFADGRLQFNSGCNRGSGTYEVGDGTLTVGPIALTKMACAPDVMALESAMLAALHGTVGYEITADVLDLTGAEHGLVLRASE